jgi:hypothetical protein
VRRLQMDHLICAETEVQPLLSYRTIEDQLSAGIKQATFGSKKTKQKTAYRSKRKRYLDGKRLFLGRAVCRSVKQTNTHGVREWWEGDLGQAVALLGDQLYVSKKIIRNVLLVS